MIKNILCFFSLLVILCSCGISDSLPLTYGGSFSLLYSDSTSVITSSQDTLIISYNKIYNGTIEHHSYKAPIDAYQKDYFNSFRPTWSANDSIYIFYIGHLGSDSIFMECKGRTDTLVIRQDPTWWLDPLEVIFNGKETYIPNYRDECVPLVR